jgi:hypothetical protein
MRRAAGRLASASNNMRKRVKKMRFKPSIVAGVVALGIAAPATAAEFLVQIGSPVGTPSCGSVTSGLSSTPVGRELICSSPFVPGGLDALAAATYGYVGGTSAASHGGGYFGTAFGISTDSLFTDFVTFTSDPNVTSVLIAANLAFSGTMNATASGNAGVDLFYALAGGAAFVYSASTNGIARNDFNVAQGGISSTFNNALLQTNTFSIPTNTPIMLTMRLGTGAGVAGSGDPTSASAEFSNSFEVPFGIDAFVLPAGVTANAGDWLVNNRRVGPTAVGAIPEPATWAMMILGFGGAGVALRMRRHRAAAA